MGSTRRSSFRLALVTSLALVSLVLVVPASWAATSKADTALQRALDAFVKRSDGPNGISVVVQRGAEPLQFTAGVGDVATKAPFGLTDAMRLASVAKAFSGAAALSAVADGKLTLESTVGEILPQQSATWAKVTLAQLLQHTSGIPDFSKSPAFAEAVGAALETPQPPEQLPTYVANDPLKFPSGSKYAYSNTDNILVGLMVAAVDGVPYDQSLEARVYTPFGLTGTSLPVGVEMPTPYTHGYQPDPPNADEDVSKLVAAGWSWASGGVVSTPQDANVFARGLRVGQGDRRGHEEAAVHVPARQVGADRPWHQLRRSRHLPLPDVVRHGVRAHRQHVGLHAVHRLDERWHALGGGVDQRADHSGAQPEDLPGAPRDLRSGGVLGAEGLTRRGHGRP